MTQPPSHPQRAAHPPRAKQANLTTGITVWPADGGRVVIWSFYWSMYVMVDKSDRPVLYTPERIEQMDVVWRRE